MYLVESLPPAEFRTQKQWLSGMRPQCLGCLGGAGHRVWKAVLGGPAAPALSWSAGLTWWFPGNVKQAGERSGKTVARSLCCQLAVSSDKSAHRSEPQHPEKLPLMVLKEGTLS